MSDNRDNKKKGFFSRLFGGSDTPKETSNTKPTSIEKDEIPSLSSVKKMKKADIVDSAKAHGLDLDISLTKVKLIEAWELHFNSSKVNQEETSVEEVAPAEEAPAEEAPAEEEALAEEAPAEEEAPVEEAPAEEAPAEKEAAEETKVSLEEKNPSQIIKDFETKQMKSDLPDFRPGDTVVVSVKVKEGQRTRLQAFEGVVMGIKKAGLNSSFIVRKISSGIGVERTFQTHSPLIDSIKVKRKGDVRQSKLFYLRERSGKSARIKERLD